MSAVMNFLVQPENLMAAAIVVGILATVITLVLPMFGGDKLNSRMKSVALEREQLRARERARMASEKGERARAVKREPGAAVKSLVDKLNLRSALADEQTTDSLVQAGYRGQSPLFMFLAARVILPIVFAILALIYFLFVHEGETSTFQLALNCAIAAGVGFYIPVLILKNRKGARQLSIRQAWPDALDLCLICVESGMSIEAAFRRVASEIGAQSLPLAEELMLTTAELSYLTERRMAYDNLTKRTGLDSVKDVVLSLTQAEKYGTPLSQALRVLSRENRDIRMNLAERKAAALGPKLTVPMMVCFLPILFCVILGPAIIGALGSQ